MPLIFSTSQSRIFSFSKLQEFLAITPKELKFQISNYEINNELVFVDQNWIGRPIDTREGDYLIIPKGTKINGQILDFVKETLEGNLFTTVGIGIVKLELDNWSSFLRVSKANYIGLNKYRHLEE